MAQEMQSLHLHVHLRQSVLLVGGCITQISVSCSLDNVADNKALNSLVLGGHATAVAAADRLAVAATVLPRP
eukprot:EC719112.1.p1 GENE.EC719112.1~~EC719112.1.p1  ORF type:complete len:72 (-),score=6.01 EC719112.1:7-222(-)